MLVIIYPLYTDNATQFRNPPLNIMDVDENPWAPVIEALDKQDEHMIGGGKESIDSFLTFVRTLTVRTPVI